MDDREAIYDEEIAPALLALGKRCEALGMPFVAVCQYADEGTSDTAFVPKDASSAMRLAYYAAQCCGNVDMLILTLLRDAERNGDNSVYLRLLRSFTAA